MALFMSVFKPSTPPGKPGSGNAKVGQPEVKSVMPAKKGCAGSNAGQAVLSLGCGGQSPTVYFDGQSGG